MSPYHHHHLSIIYCKIMVIRGAKQTIISDCFPDNLYNGTKNTLAIDR